MPIIQSEALFKVIHRWLVREEPWLNEKGSRRKLRRLPRFLVSRIAYTCIKNQRNLVLDGHVLQARGCSWRRQSDPQSAPASLLR
ncbi:hypothetical protein Pla22_21840 [Rubripirellula amarantea]|uniref:Uncharacterized protein n=1 Tax=Rubripirellula amarantea TaxID=2527999 RepID=A0A5C5WV57_9BACT|nr:hypothetical protein Pla22_21840 [Rubripirellula amarantea]